MLGMMASKRLDNRQRFLRQYISFINQIKTQIEFSGSNLSVIFSICDVDKPFKLFVENLLLKLDNGVIFTDAWESSVNQTDKSIGLKSEDITIISEFGRGLGISDIQGQVSHCTLHSELGNIRYNDARECVAKKSKLYKTMGLMCGIAISIIIV